MGALGANGRMVEMLVGRASELTLDEAADIYHARATRLLVDGDATRRALKVAYRTADRTGRLAEYEHARHAAVAAWRRALPEVLGPRLLVGAAIADAAGALALDDVLDRETVRVLLGPWQQAMGRLVPVGPGFTDTRRPSRPQPHRTIG